MVDNILGIIGTITGILGLAIAIFLTKWQAKVHEKEIAEERTNHAKEIAEERAYHAKEIAEERAYIEARLEREQANSERLNRLAFLTDRIFDVSIPRELRLPFYEEYISMKGNGTAVRFWLAEETREKAAANK